MVKAAKTAAILILMLLSISAKRLDYIERLKTLEGTPYLTLDCAKYIEAAHRSKVHCGAAKMWRGCDGQLEVIAEFANKSEIDPSTLRPGDVLDFHGIHVVAFVGDGFMDSDGAHNGVGRIDLSTKSPYDLWFAGPVRVVRFK